MEDSYWLLAHHDANTHYINTTSVIDDGSMIIAVIMGDTVKVFREIKGENHGKDFCETRTR